jgi:hypothetical protein
MAPADTYSTGPHVGGDFKQLISSWGVWRPKEWDVRNSEKPAGSSPFYPGSNPYLPFQFFTLFLFLLLLFSLAYTFQASFPLF